MDRVYKSPCCVVVCVQLNERETSTYDDMLILIYKYLLLYIYIYMIEKYYNNNNIYIQMKKRVHTILFFTYNYGDHIAQSFKG